MAQQPKTGAAQGTSMSEFLAKASKLAEAKPIGPSRPSSKTQYYGAATRTKWSRATDAPRQAPANHDGSRDGPPEAPGEE